MYKMLDQATEVAALLKSMAHPRRLLVLCRLAKAPANVMTLQMELKMEQAAVSQLLARLRLQGLVKAEKRGQQMVYTVADKRVGQLLETMAALYCKELLK